MNIFVNVFYNFLFKFFPCNISFNFLIHLDLFE